MFPDFLENPSDVAAPLLLGCTLTRTITLNGEKHKLVARIVETEAYDQDDPASHAFGGPSERNTAMFGPAGHLYVYVSYGMHHCCNVVCGPKGFGSGCLVRAVEPLEGVEVMRELREAGRAGKEQAERGETIGCSPRVGISKNADAPKRFFIEGNAFVSRA